MGGAWGGHSQGSEAQTRVDEQNDDPQVLTPRRMEGEAAAAGGAQRVSMWSALT